MCTLIISNATLASVYITLSSLYHHFQSGYTVPDGARVPAGNTAGLDQQRPTQCGEEQCLMAKGSQSQQLQRASTLPCSSAAFVMKLSCLGCSVRPWHTLQCCQCKTKGTFSAVLESLLPEMDFLSDCLKLHFLYPFAHLKIIQKVEHITSHCGMPFSM